MRGGNRYPIELNLVFLVTIVGEINETEACKCLAKTEILQNRFSQIDQACCGSQTVAGFPPVKTSNWPKLTGTAE